MLSSVIFFMCVHCCLCFIYCRPDLIRYDQLSDNPSSYKDNLNNAFKVAEQELGIAQILDPEGDLL